MKQIDFNKHKTTDCPLTLVECSSCRMMMPKGQLHKTSEECLREALSKMRELEATLAAFKDPKQAESRKPTE